MKRILGSAISLTALLWTPAVAQTAPPSPQAENTGEIVVTARRREENLQDVPIAITALSGRLLDQTGAYTIQQVTQLQPSVQFISSNPRNTAFNIRGLGSNYGLANDGLEQGVGFYVDEVYFARPASSTIDLVDVERLEILRGPQGTLFGKNTTAGAISVTTRAPSFEPEARTEFSIGDYGFIQAKATVSGPLIDNLLAGRLSIGATERDGFIRNVTTNAEQNNANNRTVRGQLLFTPYPNFDVRLSADYSEQETDCCTQVYVGYGPTLRPAAQQFPALAAAFGYAPPSTNPYDRLADVNSPVQADQRLGGVSATVNWDFGAATLTSISAWRAWEWRPANDRDYTALSIRTASNNPSDQSQFSQEIRLASNGSNTIDWVAGLYFFNQEIETNGREEWGADAARWLIGPSVPANLLDGYLSTTHVVSETESYAVFGQATWNVTDRLRISPGVRYTIEDKTGSFDQVVSGGLATSDPVLIARQLGIARPQSYDASFSDESPSGQINVAYDITPDILTYLTYALGYKSGGINAAGIPTDSAGNPALVSAVIDPEETTTVEFGVKTQFFQRALTLNLAVYSTDVTDYQANVVDTGPGALRGYLANIDKVEVRGIELEARYAPNAYFTSYATAAYTDATYASFPNGPCPLELIGATTTACDLTGRRLPGVSEWSASAGAEYSHPLSFGALDGEGFAGFDASYRSDWNSDASVSRYATIDASTIVNLRLGYRTGEGAEAFFFIRNAFDEEYLTLTSVQAGNSGAIYGTPGDPRTLGVTFRQSF